ncbi:MAG TPA: phage minor head protein [Candidatus Cloacimonadota bacterium]|nr:phage minor head protein [Candidatus Cloacimonadota bacterium]
MNLIKILALRSIAKSSAVSELNDLFMKWIEGSVLSDDDLKSRLADIFARPEFLKRDDPEYSRILSLARQAYTPARELRPDQRQALAETLYQKSINLFHLKEYKQRGTRKVQIRAIIDARTTPQCVQMHGRVFDLPDLIKGTQNQIPLVHDNAWWQNVSFFRGVPSSQVIPALPPYHYNCRTRIVPYLYADEYDSFDSLPPQSPIFPSILSDHLANYDLDSSHLPSIQARAGLSSWKIHALTDHFQKHASEFNPAYSSPRNYSAAAYALIQDSAATLCLRIEDGSLIFYAGKPAPNSGSGSWLVTVCNLTRPNILSYHIKNPKQIQRILAKDINLKSMVFEPIKKGACMPLTKPRIDQAVAELKEIHPIERYEDAIRIIKTGDPDDLLVYADDLADFRMDTIHILIQANLLSPAQLNRIKTVDDYLSSHSVPSRLQALKDWLISINHNELDTTQRS